MICVLYLIPSPVFSRSTSPSPKLSRMVQSQPRSSRGRCLDVWTPTPRERSWPSVSTPRTLCSMWPTVTLVSFPVRIKSMYFYMICFNGSSVIWKIYGQSFFFILIKNRFHQVSFNNTFCIDSILSHDASHDASHDHHISIYIITDHSVPQCYTSINNITWPSYLFISLQIIQYPSVVQLFPIRSRYCLQ